MSDSEKTREQLMKENGELRCALDLAKENQKGEKSFSFQENYSWLESIMTSLPGYIAYVGADDLKYKYVNLLFEKSFGIPREKIIGTHIREIIGAENYKFATKFVDLVREGRETSYENTFDLVGGKRWIRVNYKPDFDRDGKVVGIIVLSYDITELKMTEAALRESEDKYKRLLDGLGENYCIFSHTLEGDFVYASAGFETVFGIKPEYMIGKNWRELDIPEESIKAGEKYDEQTIKGVSAGSVELDYNHPDGSKHIIEVIESRVDANDGGSRLEGICIDITERKNLEISIREKVMQLESVLSFAPIILAAIDLDGVYIFAEGKGMETVGLAPSDVIGRNIFDLGRDRPDFLKFVRRALAGETVTETVKFQDDFLRISMSPIYREEGDQISGAVMISVVVTETEIARQSLQIAYEELKQLDELKNNFLSNVSHELRTPLVSVKGYLELLLHKLGSHDVAAAWLEIALKGAKRLESSISDLLDISMVDSEDQVYEFADVDIREVIEDQVNELDPTLSSKMIEVQLIYPESIPVVKADRSKVNSVLNNILNNAIKFSPEKSSIRIKLALRDEKELMVTVEDDGIGVPEHDLTNIFKKFYQVDSSTTRKFGGFGIGLSLVKDIITKHGGIIWCESQPGEGAVFNFTLPVSNISTKTASTEERPDS